jgi:hypothetical protein
MADSTLSIVIRDTERPCAPYQSSAHSFFVQIYHCDGTPLVWKGVNYGNAQPLDVPGAKRGNVHAQVKVPPGCYLVRGMTPSCGNFLSDWVWVEVCCSETVCANIVFPSIRDCVDRTRTGLELGAVIAEAEIVPWERLRLTDAVETARDSLINIVRVIDEQFPDIPHLPEPPSRPDMDAALKAERS